MLKTFYGSTLEECIEQANAFGREILHFHYESTSYPIQQYRLVVAFGGLR